MWAKIKLFFAKRYGYVKEEVAADVVATLKQQVNTDKEKEKIMSEKNKTVKTDGAIAHRGETAPRDNKEMHYFDARAEEIVDATSQEDMAKYFEETKVTLGAPLNDDGSGTGTGELARVKGHTVELEKQLKELATEKFELEKEYNLLIGELEECKEGLWRDESELSYGDSIMSETFTSLDETLSGLALFKDISDVSDRMLKNPEGDTSKKIQTLTTMIALLARRVEMNESDAL